MSEAQDILAASLDRRVAARVDFGARVSVCEYSQGGKVPPENDFRSVKGSNLSQSGFSFLTNDWPTSDLLVVAFGDDDSARVIARIVNIRPDSKDAELRCFEVCCEFTEWLASS